MQQYPDFFVDSNSFTVDLDKGQWVKIKSEMGIGDHEIYESSLLQYQIEPDSPNRATRRRRLRGSKDDEDTKQGLTISTGDVALLELNILEWSFEGVPINKETIRKLKESWAKKIIAAIGDQNPTNPLEKDSQPAPTSSTKTS